MTDKADGSVVLVELPIFFWKCDKMLMYIGVRMSIMASPSAWTNFAGM